MKKTKSEHSLTATERELYETTLSRLDTFSYWTDSNIRIPFTKVRFGLSPLIGLVPVIGDFAGLVLSLYVLYEARRVQASATVQRRMIRNMLVEFVGGMVPVIGNAFDALFKANTRNTDLLRRYLFEQLDYEQKQPFPWFTLIWLSALTALVIWGIIRLF